MVELLAPAGDMECFNAAISAGADAIYMAGQAYGARASATNFTTEEYIECLNKAHLLGKKIYLTLNTLIKESEWENIYDFVKPLYEAGLDGVIFQDLGLIDYLSEYFPDLPLHASTQLTITDIYSANKLKKHGITRVVPARELSLEEIARLKNETGLEIETFIHGALCYSYSGACLFSSYLGGRSGNRGRCAGPCRLPYSCIGADDRTLCKEKYPLSLKDLCVVQHVYELLDAGIDSFKIEGRLKRPEYVAGVTAIYRKYIDAYYSGNRIPVSKEDLDTLSSLYLRSNVGSGYYYRHNGKDMISIDNPSYNSMDESVVDAIADKIKKSEIKVPIDIKAKFALRKSMMMTVKAFDAEIRVGGPEVDEATGRPALREDVIKQLSKLGGTNFSVNSIDVELEDNCFLPVGQLNELRRNAVSTLLDALLSKYRRVAVCQKDDEKTCEKYRAIISNNKNIGIRVSNIIQLKAAVEYNAETIYLPFDLLFSGKIDDEYIKSVKESFNGKLYLVSPRIIRAKDAFYLDALSKALKSGLYDGILACNLEICEYITEQNIDIKVDTDASVYAFNNHSKEFISRMTKRITYPYELSLKDMEKYDDRSGIIIVYGHAPLMVSANCTAKTFNNCMKDTANYDSRYYLKDRYNKEHICITNCIHCYNEIFNAVPTSLHNKMNDILKAGFNNFRIDLTVEDYDESVRVLDYYFGNTDMIPFDEFTTGHIGKGAI